MPILVLDWFFIFMKMGPSFNSSFSTSRLVLIMVIGLFQNRLVLDSWVGSC